MLRKIKFRGQRCSVSYDGQDKWVYGYYVESNRSWRGHKPHKSWIVDSPFTNGGWFSLMGRTAVKDDTVGQYTGYKDCKGVEIYENDILRFGSLEGVITWHPDGYWCIHECEYDIKNHSYRSLGEMIDYLIAQRIYYDVIGNIHDSKTEKEINV